MIEKIITQDDVSPHLRTRLQKAGITHAADLKNILENKKQSGKRKTVFTSDFNNVHFTVLDVNEIDEFIELLNQKNLFNADEEE